MSKPDRRYIVFDPEQNHYKRLLARKIPAFDYARGLASKQGYPIEVWDCMAHYGQPAVWSVDREGYKATRIKMHKPESEEVCTLPASA